MEEAAFSLESYRFTRASFNFDIPAKAHLEVDFNPRGNIRHKRELMSYVLM